MTPNRVGLFVALTVVLLLGGGVLLLREPIFGAAPGAPDPARLALGAHLYAEHCAACHGADLEGEPNWRQRGPDGSLPAPPHDETGHTWHHPDPQLVAMTKLGAAALVGPDYKSTMIGFGDVLSDQEIRAILDYIKSRWPEDIRRRQAEITRRAAGAD
jgi:mono/diheme cytochrome c family protein